MVNNNEVYCNITYFKLEDLFGAGIETTSSLMLFAFLYMIKYPEVQVMEIEIQKVSQNDWN